MQFNVQCPCDPPTDVDFTNQMIRDVLIRGLCDHDIQQDILGQQDQNMELEKIIALIEAKEAGKRSQTSIMTEGAHVVSQYHKTKSNPTEKRQPQENKTTCERCSKLFIRPLGRRGKPRLFRMCKQCFTNQKLENYRKTEEPTQDENGVIIDNICTLMTQQGSRRKPIKLSHHVYNDLEGWKKRRSLPQPTITISATVCKDDYIHFGACLKSKPAGGYMQAIADTGCQSCLLGINVAFKLGFKESDFLPVEYRMNAVNKNSINIIGAIILRLRGSDKEGYPLESAQICYITPDTDKMFISREACIDLGLITSSFPMFGDVSQAKDPQPSYPDSASSAKDSRDQNNTCECPDRSLPPPIPTKLPFSPTEDNVDKLKQWLLNYYASSTFNICPHSPLPLMSGPPVKLMIDPAAKPVCRSYTHTSTFTLARKGKGWIGSRC